MDIKITVIKDWEHLYFTAEKEGCTSQKIELSLNYGKGEYAFTSRGEEAVDFSKDSIEEGLLKLKALEAGFKHIQAITDPLIEFPFVQKSLKQKNK